MSASFLAAADDFLTRVLFDEVIFKEESERTTGKMDHSAPRVVLEQKDLDAISRIVARLREGKLASGDAVALFSKIKCTKEFVAKWKSDEAAFIHHARRYFSALRPDSGIAFRETDRYTKPIKSARNIPTPSPTPPPGSPINAAQSFIDVAVFATKAFKKGETINLKGGIASLTEEEDDQMRIDGTRKDFSVIYTSRKDCFSLLLGPARFVNHDCFNNVEFYKDGASLRFKALVDIQIDEELFTHYGAGYFEESNAACLCATCEQHERGAFANPNRDTSIELVAAAPASGHAVTAQRSIIGKLRPPPPPIKIIAPAPYRSKGKRKSDRLTIVIDHIRTGKRLVHPHLPPPIGYAANYEYDETKHLAKFIVVEPRENGRKRRRADDSSSESDSDDSEEDSDFEVRGKMEKPVPRLLDRRVSLPNRSRTGSTSTRDRLNRRSSLGQRSSARISNNDGLLTRQKIFAALQDLMSDSDSSGLSGEEGSESESEEGSESESEESESDFRNGRKILAGQEEVKREASEDQIEVSTTSLDDASTLRSSLSAPFLPDAKPLLPPSPTAPSHQVLPTPSTASPPSSIAPNDAENDSTPSSQSNRNRRSSRNNDAASSSLSGPSGSSAGSSSDIPAKEGGGAAGDEDGNEKRKITVDVHVIDIEPEELEEGGEDDDDDDTCLKDRNEDEREAVALMLLLGRSMTSTASASPKPPPLPPAPVRATTPDRIASPKPPSLPPVPVRATTPDRPASPDPASLSFTPVQAPRAVSRESSLSSVAASPPPIASISAASPQPIASTSAPSPHPIASTSATPAEMEEIDTPKPIASTSAARASSELDDADSATSTRRSRPSGSPNAPRAGRPVRTIRAKPTFESPPLPPKTHLTSAQRAHLRNIANGTEQRKRGRPAGAIAHVTPPLAIARPTRTTNPIADPMKEFLQTNAITSVIGGWDSVRRRYYNSEHGGPRPTPPSQPAPNSPAVDEEMKEESEEEEEEEVVVQSGPRGTRSSQPIRGDISSIISSKEALRLTGGYDEKLGKYVGRRSL